MRSVTLLLIALATLGGSAAVRAAPVPLAAGGTSGTADTGTLALRAVLAMEGRGDFCPPGTSSSIECFKRDGTGVVRGLGKVSESYVYRVETQPSGCPAGSFRVLATTARLTVAGKGEIDAAVAESPDCRDLTTVLTLSRAFTISGGSGIYAGASGNGTLRHVASLKGGGAAAGIDTWVGTLVVPALEFDLTPPTLSGAVGKTIRAPRGAKSVRVTYKVTARDDVDGVVPVSCRPRSGSRFTIGRTRVRCSATDTSGNTRTAKFTITVKARG